MAEPERARDIIFEQVAKTKALRRGASKGAIRRSLERSLTGGLEVRVPERALPAEAPSPRARRRRGWRPWPRLRVQENGRIIWHKHWLNLIARTLLPFTLSLLTLAGAIAAIAGFTPFPQLADVRAPVFLVLLLLFLFAVAWFWWNYEDWQNDIYIVTDDRIIDIEKKPLFFAEERREASLAKVQNVILAIPGPVAYLLNFGDVIIQTAAETGAFTFHFVSNPREVQNEIFRRLERYREAEAAQQGEQRQAEFLEWLSEFDRLQRERGEGTSSG
jgi:hypothetical protein